MSEKKTLPDLNGILPARAIRIHKHGLANRWFYLFLSIVTAFACVAIVVAWGPGLYSDYLIKKDPVLLEGANINDGQCRTKKMIVSCKATIVYDHEGENRIKPVEFSFLSLSNSDYETEVVMQRSDPDNVTLSLAIDEFWNRLASGVVLLGLIGGLSILFLVRFWQILRSARVMKSAASPGLSWARIRSSKKSLGTTKITYNPLAEGHRKKDIVTGFSRNEVPFMHFDEAEDETYGIVAIHPAAPLPVLLDENFERLDLNGEERSALQQALEARIGA